MKIIVYQNFNGTEEKRNMNVTTITVVFLFLSSFHVSTAVEPYNVSICHSKVVFKIGYGLWTNSVQLKENSSSMDGTSIDHLEG